jgi:hypothetical protein
LAFFIGTPRKTNSQCRSGGREPSSGGIARARSSYSKVIACCSREAVRFASATPLS